MNLKNFETRVFGKQPFDLYEIVVKFDTFLPSPDSTYKISLGILLL